MTGNSGLGGTLGRAGWSLLDQGLSSVTNLALTALIARSSTPAEFGAFAAAMAVYLFALNVSRSLASDALLVRYSQRSISQWREGTSQSLGVALAVSCVMSILVALVAQFFTDALRDMLVVLAVGLPGLLLQDACRFAFFANGAPRQAAANDAIWGVAQICFFGAAAEISEWSGRELFLLWAMSAYIAAAMACRQARVRPGIRRLRIWIREQQDLIGRFLVEYLIDGGSAQAGFAAAGSLAGLVALGAMNGGRLLVGPLTVIFLGMNAFSVAEGVALQRHAKHRLLPMFRAMALAVCLLSAAWGLALSFLPDRWGGALLGQTWTAAHAVLFAWVLHCGLNGCTQLARSGLRSFGAASQTLRNRVLIAPVTVACMVGGAAWRGAEGASFGLALSGLFGVLVWWLAFERECRRRVSTVPSV